LEWILRYLALQGIGDALVSAGHLADQVNRFAGGLRIPGLRTQVIVEHAPLGTAGGFLNAVCGTCANGGKYIALNGDSLVLTSLAPFFRCLDDPAVDAVLLAVRVDDASRYGTVHVDGDGRLCGFLEKRPGPEIVNAGVYGFRERILTRFPRARPLSFEYDVFPALIASGAVIRVLEVSAPFLDIGTEEALALADDFIAKNMNWFR
jgi:D-glycero-alpha-D-manno-heptose 1-phosphate guanylyltransferase